MKIKILPFVAWNFFILSSCASANLKTNGTDASAIQDLSILKHIDKLFK